MYEICHTVRKRHPDLSKLIIDPQKLSSDARSQIDTLIQHIDWAISAPYPIPEVREIWIKNMERDINFGGDLNPSKRLLALSEGKVDWYDRGSDIKTILDNLFNC